MVYRPKIARESDIYRRRARKKENKNVFASNDVSADNRQDDVFNYYEDNNEAPEVDSIFGERNLSADFDGDYLNVWDDDKLIGQYRARSGYDNYQDKKYTGVKDRGPLPEGKYMLYYDQLEEYSPEESEKWMKNTASWGFERVPVNPEWGTNTLDRDGFYVHGGRVLKSAGCIDLGIQMPQFGGIMKKYRQNIPLTVKYKDGFGKKDEK